jgi:N,N'-diacetyllegionaminate synthase
MEVIVRIGSRSVGQGEPCYVIAEAGSNHNGSLDQARTLIDVAADAGADAVKFQVFRADRLYPKNAGISGYLNDPTPIYDVIAAMEMPYEWIPILADHCRDRQVAFMASAFDEASSDEIAPYVPAFKVASYEMTHLPLVDHIARKGKPVIVSTGTADLEEVAGTVAAFAATGNRQLILMQCTAAYPAPLDSLNVRAMSTMRERFGVPVGLSDHSSDPVIAPVVAVACGAAVVEKHFTLSRTLPGPDHRFALEPSDLQTMIAKIREAEAALGSARKAVAPVEEELRAFARRSIFVRRAIPAGEPFTADNLLVLRNGSHRAGLPPEQLAAVIGRRAARAVAADSALQPEDLA